MGFFLKNNPFSHVTETNGSFSKVFGIWEKTFRFSWENREKIYKL